MPELIAKTALFGRAPLTLANTELAEVDHGVITSIAVLPGLGKAVDKMLKPLGFSFPNPNSFTVKAAAMLVWTGRDQAFLIGADAPALGDTAAVTDQSGGWVSLRLAGPQAEAALMRHVPMDLRAAAFPVGMAARAPLNHMQMILLRLAADEFRVMVFRSMARTAWHEIEMALRTLAARAKVA